MDTVFLPHDFKFMTFVSDNKNVHILFIIANLAILFYVNECKYSSQNVGSCSMKLCEQGHQIPACTKEGAKGQKGGQIGEKCSPQKNSLNTHYSMSRKRL